jgi:hypothetical protein
MTEPTRRSKRKNAAKIIPERMVYFRCKNEKCSFVGCGVVDRLYIRCSKCRQWSSVWKQSISKEDYDLAWGK